MTNKHIDPQAVPLSASGRLGLRHRETIRERHAEGVQIWMLVNLEPGYERLHVGDGIEATTEWCQPEMLPPELVSRDVQVQVERVAVDGPGGYDSIARSHVHICALLPLGRTRGPRDDL